MASISLAPGGDTISQNCYRGVCPDRQLLRLEGIAHFQSAQLSVETSTIVYTAPNAKTKIKLSITTNSAELCDLPASHNSTRAIESVSLSPEHKEVAASLCDYPQHVDNPNSVSSASILQRLSAGFANFLLCQADDRPQGPHMPVP
jgi:hypothetical protein